MKIIDLEQGSEEWLAWRFGGVGASDMPSVLGISPYKGAAREDLLSEKVRRIGREATYPMRRGKLHEPAARAMYAKLAGCEARPVCVEHDGLPWARASLDGLCHNGVEQWVLEVKVPGEASHRLALGGVVPDCNRPQVQWQMFVTGLTRCDYVSYSWDAKRFGEADRLAVVPVAWDEEWMPYLVAMAQTFWGEVLAAREAAGVA